MNTVAPMTPWPLSSVTRPEILPDDWAEAGASAASPRATTKEKTAVRSAVATDIGGPGGGREPEAVPRITDR